MISAENKKLGIRGRILYAVIAVVLVTLLGSLLNRTATEKIGSVNDLPLTSFIGEQVTLIPDAGEVLISPEKDKEAIVYVGAAESPYNVLLISGEGVSTSNIDCFYVKEGASDGKLTESKGFVLEDGRIAFVAYSPSEGSFELHVLEPARISYMKAVEVSGYEFGYRFNLRAFIILVIFLGLLLAFEKKIRFIFNTGVLFRRTFASLLTTCEQKGRRALALRSLSLAAILTFIIAALCDFLFVVISPSYSLVLAVLGALAVAGAIAEECYFRGSLDVARLFLAVSLIIGSVIVLCSPISTQVSWDDGYHFARFAYAPAVITEWRLPLSANVLAHEKFSLAVYSVRHEEVLGIILSSFEKNASLNLGAVSAFFEGFKWYYILLIPVLPLALVYYAFDFIAYIPAWFSMTLIGAFGADYAKVFVYGKLLNLVVYSLLVYFAIRRLKSGKYIFVTIALLPVFLFLGGQYSCDWWINGAMMLGYAYLIGTMQRKGEIFRRFDLFIIIFFMAFATGPKQIYFIMLAPLLFLPRSKFKSKKSARLTKTVVLLTMLAILMTFLVPMLVNPESRTDSRGGSDVSSSGQISFILHNPFEYLGICLRFLAEYFSIAETSANFTLFGWLGGEGTAAFGLLAIIAMLFAMFTDRSEHDLFPGAGKFRFWNLAACFCAVVLVATSLYVAYTPVGHYTVNGCQHRYMYPIFPIVLWSLGSHRIENKMSESVKCATIFTMSCTAAIGAFVSAWLV